MKTIQLIELLDDKEKKELIILLQVKKRNSLLKLCKHLFSSDPKHLEKQKIYKQIFSEKYSESKDYLLRNELRLLNTEIEKLIVKKENKSKEQTNELKQDIAILERIIRTKQSPLFKVLFADIERKANKMNDYKTVIKIYDLVIEYYTKYQEVSIDNYVEMIGYLNKKEKAIQQHLDELKAETGFKKNFAAKVIQVLDENKFNEIKLSNPEKKIPNPIADYLNLYGESYLLKGKEKIDALKKLITLQPKVEKLRPERKKDLASLYGNLGLELFLHHKYQEADTYYKIALKQSSDGKTFLDLYFNYCANALLIGKYTEVTRIYEKYYEEINTNEKLKYRFRYFTIIAYLLLNKTNTAFQMLDHEITQRPVTEYYYYRLVFAMVYFQRGDMENADREIENILQSFRFRKSAKMEDKPLVKILKKMILAESFKHQKEKYKQEIAKINEETTSQDGEKSKFSTLIYNWILFQIKIKS